MCQQFTLVDKSACQMQNGEVAKDSAGIFVSRSFISICLKVCIMSVISWKDEAFHFWIIVNAQILCINSSQWERGNGEGE